MSSLDSREGTRRKASRSSRAHSRFRQIEGGIPYISPGAHTITALLSGLIILYFFSHFMGTPDSNLNLKHALAAMCFVFLGFCVFQLRDGFFVRPHPAFWRFITGVSILYFLCLVFLLFQTKDDARFYMQAIDPTLGQPIPLAAPRDCRIFITPLELGRSLLAKLRNDWMVLRLASWWARAVIFRDYTLCWTLSLGIESAEWFFGALFPMLHRCWWERLANLLGCNAIGIFAGIWTVKMLEIDRCNWTGESDSLSPTTRQCDCAYHHGHSKQHSHRHRHHGSSYGRSASSSHPSTAASEEDDCFAPAYYTPRHSAPVPVHLHAHTHAHSHPHTHTHTHTSSPYASPYTPARAALDLGPHAQPPTESLSALPAHTRSSRPRRQLSSNLRARRHRSVPRFPNHPGSTEMDRYWSHALFDNKDAAEREQTRQELYRAVMPGLPALSSSSSDEWLVPVSQRRRRKRSRERARRARSLVHRVLHSPVIDWVTPWSFDRFRWAITLNPQRFFLAVLAITSALLVDINAQALRTVLWVPLDHKLQVARFLLWFCMALPGIREYYEYIIDPSLVRIGSQAWLCLANAMGETLLILKLCRDELPAVPRSRVVTLAIACVAFVLYSLRILLRARRPRKKSAQGTPDVDPYFVSQSYPKIIHP